MTSPQRIVLVPSERHVEAALAANDGADVAVRVATLRGFMTKAAAALVACAFASTSALRLAAGDALEIVVREEDDRRWRAPEEAAGKASLAAAIDRSIGRLRRAGTSARELAGSSRRDGARLGRILARVDASLARARLVDPRGAGLVAARALRVHRDDYAAVDRFEELGAREVEVRGVLSFDGDDLVFLEALHGFVRERGGAGVRVVLPKLDDERSVATIADELERRWASLADAPEIEWTPASAVEETRSRLVVRAQDADGEARAIAARVRAMIAAGAAPESIAIVVPSLEDRSIEPLRAALVEARVASSEPRGRAATASPEGRVVLALLAIAVGPVAREDVIDLLRAPGVHAGYWMERANDVDAAKRARDLAHRLREVPVAIDVDGRLLLEGLAARADDDERWMVRALGRLLEMGRHLRGSATRAEHAARLAQTMDLLKLGKPPGREIEAALRDEARGGALALRAIGEGSAAVRAIREATNAIALAATALGAGDRAIAIDAFAAELRVAAEDLGTGLGAGAARAGAVRIGRPPDFAGLDHDVVFVSALVEQAYGVDASDDALLDERLRVSLPVGSRPRSSAEVTAARRAELEWIAASAKRVVLSYATGDDHEPAPEHTVVREALRAGAEVVVEPASRVGRAASCGSDRAAELVALAAGATPSPFVAARADVERARTRFFLDPRAPADAWNGAIDLGPLAARLASAVGGGSASEAIGVTAVERAARCAFVAFTQNVLRLRKPEELDEIADARERGNFVHTALQAAFEAIERGEDPRRAASRAVKLDDAMPPLRREAVLQAVEDALLVLARPPSGLAMLGSIYAERAFGDVDSAWPALELASIEGAPSIFLKGRIDRVDRSADGLRARVVDYKTGSVPSVDDHGRTALQLPLYAEVVRRALGVKSVEAAYVTVKNRGLVDVAPKKEEQRARIGAMSEDSMRTAQAIVLSLWRGQAAPRPAKASFCARCEARDACRRPAAVPIDERDDT